MRQALLRFVLYLILLVSIFAAFDFLTPILAPTGSFTSQLGFYVENYGVLFVLLTLVFELIFRCVRWGRHRIAPNMR
jgi:hypothetical protein